MRNKATFTYKPQPNGPLEPRVRHIQVMLAKVDLMTEDRDAKADLSTEPDLLDLPGWAGQFFGLNVATEEIIDDDDDDDDTAYGNYRDNNWDLSPEEEAELDELNRKHNTEFYRPEDLMTLRRLDSLRLVQETYCVCDLSKGGSGNAPDTPVDEPIVIWFEVDEVAIPSQSSCRYDDYVKQLSWSSDNANRSWRQSHGSRGRHKKRPWWSALAERRRRSKKETLDDNQSSYSPREAPTANHWLDDMADFDGEMTFDESATRAQYFAGLMSSISEELKAEWAEYNPPNWEFALEQELLDELWDESLGVEREYEWGYYLRSPHEPSTQGWWFMDLPYHARMRFEQREMEEELAQARQDNRLLQAHMHNVIYGDPYDYYDVGFYRDFHDQHDDLPSGYYEEDERRRVDDTYEQAVAEAEAAALDDIDHIDYPAPLDIADQATTIAQHGGPRGWKANKVAHLRQAEFA